MVRREDPLGMVGLLLLPGGCLGYLLPFVRVSTLVDVLVVVAR